MTSAIVLVLPSSWTVIGAPWGNHLWQSTLFAGVVWLLTLLLRKNRAQSRYVLWLVASAKFLIPFSLLFALGSHLPWSRTPAVTQPAVFVAMETLSGPFAPINPTSVAPLPTLSALEVATRFLPTFLLIAWSIGCAAVILRWYLRWRRLNSARRAALPLQSGRELAALRRMEQTARLPRQIDLLRTRSALEPGILGIFRPALLLPGGISEKLTDLQLESVIAHELCHVRRLDNLAAAFHMLVEALFWFHPLVWWIGAQLVDERERACDEEVLRLGADPHLYAEGILKICKFYLESPQLCAAGVTGSNFKKRIEAIMMNRKARSLELRKKLLLGTLGAAVVVTPVAFGLLHSPQSRAESLTSNPPITPAFEVASVQPSRPGDGNTGVGIAPGRITLANWTVKGLLLYAYNLEPVGGPGWVDSKRYDVDLRVNDALAYESRLIETNVAGRFPPGLRHDQLRLIVQSLLADQFKLRLSRETKQVPVYALVIAKGGPKLRQAKVGDTYADGILDPDGLPVGPNRGTGQDGRFIAQALPMSTVAEVLTKTLGRTVLDKTELTGEYDFTLEWTPSKSQTATDGQRGIDSASPESEGSSIFTTIQEKLGLKLEPQTAPVEVLIIDHAEQINGDESGSTPPQVQSSEKSQASTAPASSTGSFSCTFDSVKYPEGTIIQEGNGPEQLCAQVQDRVKAKESGQAQHTVEWIHTSQAIRERGKDIVHLPVRPIAFCTPKPSTQSNLCSCQESGDFSTGSDVDSAKGKLTCKKGHWMPVATTHAEHATTEKQANAIRLN